MTRQGRPRHRADERTFLNSSTCRSRHRSPPNRAVMACRNQQLWIVNQDNNSVSAFDTASNQKLAEIAVGDAPRALAVSPAGEIWVTNRRGATISVVNPATLAVSERSICPSRSQPYGLVFAPDGSAAYVALEGRGRCSGWTRRRGAAGRGAGRSRRRVTSRSTRRNAAVRLPIHHRPDCPARRPQLVSPDEGGVQHGGEVHGDRHRIDDGR